YPILLGRESSLRAAQHAIERDKYVFVAAQKNPSVEEPTQDDVYLDGTVVKIVQIMKLPNGLMKILVDGVRQGAIKRFLDNDHFLDAEILVSPDEPQDSEELDALVRHSITLFREYARLNRNLESEVLTSFETIRDSRRKLFFI